MAATETPYPYRCTHNNTHFTAKAGQLFGSLLILRVGAHTTHGLGAYTEKFKLRHRSDCDTPLNSAQLHMVAATNHLLPLRAEVSIQAHGS